MNTILQNQYPLFEYYQALRQQLLDLLTDDDLEFSLPGNPTLGELCREIGETEYCYIESFRNFTQDFSYRVDDPTLEHSVARLRAWYDQLDAGLHAAIASLSDGECQNRMIDRHGWQVAPHVQLEIYKEALLIFYGKVSVYLKALDKPRPEQWREWIA